MIRKSFLFIITLFLTANIGFSDTAYKNELIKVNLSPMGVNDVKVTLQMAKPYSEPLRLLKKNDGEFVLILPETYNSAPQKPSISDVIGEVTDTDIKQYSFISNSKENGYTKIVIKTNGTTNLYPEAISNGGGSLKVNETVKKAVTEKVQPKVEQKQTDINIPVLKAEQTKTIAKVDTKTKEVQNKIDKNNKTNKEKVDFLQKNILPIFKDTKPIKEEIAPEVVEEQKIEEPVEEVTFNDKNVSNEIQEIQEQKTPFMVVIKNKLANIKSKIPNGTTKNSLITLILIAICYSIIKKAQKKKNHNTFIKKEEDNTTTNTSYSEFFKTMIEEETNGNNPFTLKPIENNSITEFEPISDIEKTQKEMFNIDPNLSWQEKFRALKKNKKELFKEEEKEENIEKNEIMQNPVTRIKQDLKAIKNLVAQQKAKKEEAEEQKQQAQEEIEVITFDDYQKNLEPPKVKINTTMPLSTNPPKILSQLFFAPKKGLYLVDYKDKYNLVGFIGDKVFKIHTYDTVRSSKMYARLTEKIGNKETYILKFDNNKMLIDVDDEKMSLKLQY